MKPVLVSSCLLGLTTRYDGTDNESHEVKAFITKHNLLPIPVCPEQLAGLPTPRKKCWFQSGDGLTVVNGEGVIIDEEGNNLTAQFLAGGDQALKIAEICGCRTAILQQRSPSCGTRKIYLGQELIPGMGTTAALLKKNGIDVFGDDQLSDENFVNHLHMD